MNTFYAFIDNYAASLDDAYTNIYTVSTRQGEAPRCSECKEFIGMIPSLPPVVAELELYGRYFGDVAFTGDQLLVSSKFLELFTRSQLIGLSNFFSVEISAVLARKRKLRNDCPLYYLATIDRSCAAIDMMASEFEWDGEPKCQECREGHLIKRWSRIVIEPGTWTGEDIFFPRGLSVILVTERFRDMYTSHGLRNGVFIPALEYSHDFYPWEKEKPSG